MRKDFIAIGVLAMAASVPASAAVVTFTVEGTDAIFLAGRDDIIIPPADQPWGPPSGMQRHPGPTPEESQETKPDFLLVSGGDVVRVLDPAVGGINFFNGLGPPYFGPDGNGLSGSNLTSFGGISGYIGPQGPLVGVFLNSTIPLTGAPITLDFSPSGLGTDFTSLAPELGQIFYIGNGQTSGGVFQEFTAPTGATRLFLGIADGFGFVGNPGAYDDNDGAYVVRIGVNEIPTPVDVPAPAALGLLGVGLAGLAAARRRSN